MLEIELMSSTGFRLPLTFERFVFNGGEPHFRLDPGSVKAMRDTGSVNITARLQSAADVLELCTAVNAIRRVTKAKLNLRIPYFPAARQDRVCVTGEALTVEVYADIINSLKADTVTIADPHSDVTPALLHNCQLYPIEDLIGEVIKDCGPTAIVIPDAGAEKRVHGILKKCRLNLRTIQSIKERDVLTGVINRISVIQPVDPTDRLLVIDDICDGGATFVALAEALGNCDKYLYVTHGIFSKGIDELLKHYIDVISTDSFKSPHPSLVGNRGYTCYHLEH